MRILALDFDGVISDSAPESFLVALRCHRALWPGSGLGADLAGDREEAAAPTRSAIVVHPLFRAFLEIMPLGNRAEDFGVALHAIEHGRAPADQTAYDAHKASLPEGFLARYHARFYEERHALSEAAPEAWAAMMAAYEPLLPLLRARAPDTVLAIATAKDRPSVESLLARYGIAELFPAERVLDKEAGVSKRAHLRALLDRLHAEPASLTFIDDKVNHLEDVEALGVRCVLAAWGYNGAREHARARERGYAVATLENAHETLFA